MRSKIFQYVDMIFQKMQSRSQCVFLQTFANFCKILHVVLHVYAKRLLRRKNQQIFFRSNFVILIRLIGPPYSAPNGYEKSPLKLNRDIAQNEHWNENALESRNEKLLGKVLELWPYPVVQLDR